MGKGKSTKSKTTTSAASDADVRGELRQLADVRAKFAALSEKTAAGLFKQHGADQCRDRGTTTRSAETFKGAMAWARTLGAHAADPGLNPKMVRWLLDCLTALAEQLGGASATAGNPADASAFDDAQRVADAALKTAKQKAAHAIGSNAGWNATLAAVDADDPSQDARVARLRKLADILQAWLADDDGPALDAVDIDASTVASLRAAAKALDDAIARRPASAQAERDAPAVNAAEGRLYFAMRVVWDQLAAAREAGTSRLQLQVTPTVLRGMGINTRRKGKAPVAS